MATELLQARSSSRSRLGSVVFAAALLGATAVGSVWYLSVPGTDRTADGALAEANLVGHDAVTDLAVLKIRSEIEPALQVADPAEPGDTVAVVDPMGPAKRQVVTSNAATSLALNGDQLVGFASQIALSLIDNGTVSHAWLGVTARPSPEQIPGALVFAVTAEGPASYGGVEPDDLITALGASSITSLETMMATLRHHQPGDIVNVVVKRGGDSISCPIELGGVNGNSELTASIPSDPPDTGNDPGHNPNAHHGGPDQG